MTISNLMARVILIALFFQICFAGGTPNQQWLVQQTRTREQGDYVSASGGGQYVTNNKYYAYFIEVPPGSDRLVVDIFDPNIFETLQELSENSEMGRIGIHKQATL
jgi:hypothetical protein